MKKLITIVLMVALGVTMCMAQEAVKKSEVTPVTPLTKQIEVKTPAVKMVGQIAIKAFPTMTAVTVAEKASDYAPKDGYAAGMDGAKAAYGLMMKDAIGKLEAWIKAGGKATGPYFGIYDQDPTTTPAKDLTCKVGYPVAADAKGNDAVKIETLPEMSAAMVQYSGPYGGSDAIYGALMKWIPEHGHMVAGSPMEVYLKGPGDTQKPEEYLTEIRFPVMKAEVKAPAAPGTPVTPDKPATPEKPVEVKKDATVTPTPAPAPTPTGK